MNRVLHKDFEICFWAKKSEKNGVLEWLPLKQHLVDTMNVAEKLWDHWLCDAQREMVEKSLTKTPKGSGRQLVRFLGAIHDIGKATPAFQLKKTTYTNSIDLDDLLIQKLANFGFQKIGATILTSASKSHHAIASQTILSSYRVNDGIASIVGGHHGKPVDSLEEIRNQLSAYEANYYQEETRGGSPFNRWKKSQEEILDWALHECNYSNVDELPTIERTVQILLMGLLIMADWIASNEEFFPLLSIREDATSIDQKERFQRGWTLWFRTHPWEPTQETDASQVYEKRFGFTPNPVQLMMNEAILDSNGPSIYILEAPMGEGKTEAALFAAEMLSRKANRSGIFFGLPTQATSNGIFKRISRWVQAIQLEDNENKSIQLVHGKAHLNKEFRSMASGVNVDEEVNGAVLVNQWFSGKKTSILDDFVIGTVDQFLLAGLKQKHLALRHLGLTKKTIIIDEIHAYDAYMNCYLDRVIHWMGVYHTPIVLLSATLPPQRRAEIIEAYIRGAGKKMKNIEQPDLWREAQEYPIITYFEGNKVKQLPIESESKQKQVFVKRIDDPSIPEILTEQLSDGGVAGIIVNTVKRAQELYKLLSGLFGEDHIELIHSAFISSDRIDIESNILLNIGKGVIRPDKRIIIGTQVLEQSLDIDFDLLITDLSPMDLLLQRIGRLHRHPLLNRPIKLKTPYVYVIGTNDEYDFEPGSASIYGDYYLMRTQYYLKDSIILPNDISNLVQKVYMNEPIFQNEILLEKYERAEKDKDALLSKKSERAKSYLLDRPKQVQGIYRESLTGWLSNVSPNDSDERGFAQVRDAADNIEVIVIKKGEKGFCFIHDDKNLCININDPDVARKLASQTIKLPGVLSVPYRIDQTIKELEEVNRQYLVEWQGNAWLRGSLGIILDEFDTCVINGWKLSYDRKYGLEYEKVVDNESV